MNKDTLRQLRKVDWDFIDSVDGVTSAIHWYPGTFPSQMPASLVEALSIPNQVVLDPYSGIGTTSSEALRLGRRAWAVDSNPIAVLTAYVTGGLLLLLRYNRTVLENVFSSVRRLAIESSAQRSLYDISEEILFERVARILDRRLRPFSQVVLDDLFNDRMPRWDLLSKWVEKRTRSDIESALFRVFSSDAPAFTKLLALSMISACMRPASSQTKSWGHIADNVYPKQFVQKNISKLYKQWLGRVEAMIFNTRLEPMDREKCSGIQLWVSRGNWMSDISCQGGRPKTRTDAIITSPPYAGAIDYTRGQRLSLYLLGYGDTEIDKMGKTEIGSRRKRFASNSETEWADELALSLEKQLGLLSDTGTVSLILPHKDHGREHGGVRLSETLESNGWNLAFRANRSIRQYRTRQSWTSIKRETIEIYEKANGSKK